jgi:hypothetical protein
MEYLCISMYIDVFGHVVRIPDDLILAAAATCPPFVKQTFSVGQGVRLPDGT